MFRVRNVAIVLLINCLMTVGALAADPAYPAKPIEIVVPFTPGGAVDVVSRIFAERLQAKWGKPVIIVNKPGGNTVIAHEYIARARPDGYTILADNPPASSMLEVVVKDRSYKLDDRTYIAIVTQTPAMFIVAADAPYAKFSDMVAEIRRAPSETFWTSLGGAGVQDVAFRLLFKEIGVDVNQTNAVGLKGGTEAVTMTAGGHVKFGVGAWSAVAGVLAAKRLRVLAVTSPERFPMIPDVPTTAELGYAATQVLSWQGFSAPKGVPESVVAVWDEALQEVLREPATLERLRDAGVVPFYKNAEAMRSFVVNESKVMRALFGSQ